MHDWFITGWSMPSGVHTEPFIMKSASDSLSKVKPKIKVKNKSAGEWGMKPIPQRSYAAAPAAAAVAGKARLASNRAPCLNMPNVACSNLRMTATRATILHFPRSCSRR
jgi:hypothetical protein